MDFPWKKSGSTATEPSAGMRKDPGLGNLYQSQHDFNATKVSK